MSQNIVENGNAYPNIPQSEHNLCERFYVINSDCNTVHIFKDKGFFLPTHITRLIEEENYLIRKLSS